jgi:hypothetical protein
MQSTGVPFVMPLSMVALLPSKSASVGTLMTVSVLKDPIRGNCINLCVWWGEVLRTLHHSCCALCFCEGPHSRRYGCTAALWLIVQPYDEDDDCFLSFS